MKLSQYIEELEMILDCYGDLDLIYSIDDEGNDYKEVHYGPAIGNYEDYEWMMYDGDDWPEDLKINAVCIN